MKRGIISLSILSLALAAHAANPKLPGGPDGDTLIVPGGGGKNQPEAVVREVKKIDKLDLSAAALCSDQAKLIKRVDTIKDTMHTSAKALGALTAMNTTLKAMEASADTLYLAAQTAETIPQSREKAKPIRESLEKTRNGIKSVRQTMTAITLKTEPMRKKLEAAADKAKQLEEGLRTVNTVPCHTRSVTRLARQCIYDTAEKSRTCVARTVAARADDLTRIYDDYDSVVRPLIADPLDWIPSVDFVNPFTADMQAIDELQKKLDGLREDLDTLANQFKPLTDVLDRKFGFSFPYPDPTLSDPFRFSDCEVKVKGRTIIEGAAAIQAEIERYLSEYLWSILRGLGVDGYVRKLENAFNSAVNEAMKNIPFHLDVNLPSLNVLENFKADELIFEEALEKLNIPEVKPDLPGLGLPGMPKGMSLPQLNSDLKKFHMGDPDFANCTPDNFFCN